MFLLTDLAAAIAVRYSYLLNDWFGDIRTVNWLSFIAFMPLFILGLGFESIVGIMLFFILIIVQNVRSPIANSVFHDNVKSKTRATQGSILSLSGSLGKMDVGKG